MSSYETTCHQCGNRYTASVYNPGSCPACGAGNKAIGHPDFSKNPGLWGFLILGGIGLFLLLTQGIPQRPNNQAGGILPPAPAPGPAQRAAPRSDDHPVYVQNRTRETVNFSIETYTSSQGKVLRPPTSDRSARLQPGEGRYLRVGGKRLEARQVNYLLTWSGRQRKMKSLQEDVDDKGDLYIEILAEDLRR